VTAKWICQGPDGCFYGAPKDWDRVVSDLQTASLHAMFEDEEKEGGGDNESDYYSGEEYDFEEEDQGFDEGKEEAEHDTSFAIQASKGPFGDPRHKWNLLLAEKLLAAKSKAAAAVQLPLSTLTVPGTSTARASTPFPHRFQRSSRCTKAFGRQCYQEPGNLPASSGWTSKRICWHLQGDCWVVSFGRRRGTQSVGKRRRAERGAL
jgi:hypothetical protein